MPDGTEVWGHGGGIPGFTNFAGGTEDGQHVISINTNVLGAEKHIKNILVSEFAGKTKRKLSIKKRKGTIEEKSNT